MSAPGCVLSGGLGQSYCEHGSPFTYPAHSLGTHLVLGHTYAILRSNNWQRHSLASTQPGNERSA